MATSGKIGNLAPSPRGGKIKVFQVIECGDPGGASNQVAAICNGLDPRLFEVGLVFASRGSDPEAFRRQASGAVKSFYVPEMIREISPGKDAAAFRKLLAILRAEKPDVVHAHSSKAGVLARLAGLAAGVPNILYSPRAYGFLRQDRPWASRAFYWAAELSVSWIGGIAATSPSELRLSRTLAWGKKVHEIHDACLLDFPDAGRPRGGREDGLLFGACGRITAQRHPEAFVRLCRALTEARPGLRCAWLGSGDEESAMRRSLREMKIESRVDMPGWIKPPELWRRMSAFDVFVHYSRWDSLGSVILEAMALGLPIVASARSGSRDAVVHGVTGFLARDEEELRDYCLRLADDPGLRRRMGEAGRARARQEFSLATLIDKLTALYGAAPLADR
jgi:glycosyltransferase involved in cell wall biosynthesis